MYELEHNLNHTKVLSKVIKQVYELGNLNMTSSRPYNLGEKIVKKNEFDRIRTAVKLFVDTKDHLSYKYTFSNILQVKI